MLGKAYEYALGIVAITIIAAGLIGTAAFILIACAAFIGKLI